MIGVDPQLATPSPGIPPGATRLRGFAPRLKPTSYLFGAAGFYCLVALTWSVAGREDLGNARASSLCAVVALAIALAAIIATTGTIENRGELFGWASLAAGVAFIASTEIARFSVIWTEKVMTWHPDAIAWLQAAGALGVMIGVFLVLGNVVAEHNRIASAIGLATFSATVAVPLVIVTRLLVSSDPAPWSTIAPLIAVAFSVAAVAVSFDTWRARHDESDLSSSGLTLFTVFIAVAIALQSLGSWDESPGLLALGRWVIPVAALGVMSAAIDRSRSRRSSNEIAKLAWPEWSAAAGRWPLFGSALLVAAAIVALSFRANIAADIAAVGSLCVLLLFGRQALTLQLELSRAERLAETAAELERIANIDMLTGLPNRSALTGRLAEEFERAFRYEQPMSLLFIDIDHFKRVNDSLGHGAGDSVLREVAESLRFTARGIDFVGRYGGEEFLIIAPGTWTADAMILAERLRNHVQRVTVSDRDGDARNITISIGIAGYPEHAADVSSLLERADEALYRAKAAGRNQSILFGSGDVE